MDWIMVARFLFGAAALIAGAEALVRGATRLATSAGVSQVVIGLTVVAVGTGSPELAVAVRSALAGQGDVTVGNVVGANILNILLILGASALLSPLAVSQSLVRRDVPILVGVSVTLWLLSLDGRLGRPEGVLLLSGMVVYTVWAVREGRREGRRAEEGYPGGLCEECRTAGHWAYQVMLIVGGLVFLGFGASLMVAAAVAFAQVLGVSELIISLTLVAIGTTLPEAATSVLAARRGQTDITVGNVIGSNLFNILAVLGIAAILSPGGLTIPAEARRGDMPLMIAAAAACLPIFVTGGRIRRREGALLLAFYGAFLIYLYLRAVDHAALVVYDWFMVYVAIPLTLGTLTILALRQHRAVPGSGERATGNGPRGEE